MKITSEDFETLRGMIQPIFERVSVETYRAKHPQFSAKRVRWDYFHAAGQPALTFICDHLYTYLNDDHIDTALKAIVGI